MPSLQFKKNEYLRAEGLNVKYYRLRLGLSQQELGVKCNWDKSYVSNIERGKNFSKLSEIKLAEALGVEPSDLVRIRPNWRKRIALTAKMQKALNKKRAKERKEGKR